MTKRKINEKSEKLTTGDVKEDIKTQLIGLIIDTKNQLLENPSPLFKRRMVTIYTMANNLREIHEKKRDLFITKNSSRFSPKIKRPNKNITIYDIIERSLIKSDVDNFTINKMKLLTHSDCLPSITLNEGNFEYTDFEKSITILVDRVVEKIKDTPSIKYYLMVPVRNIPDPLSRFINIIVTLHQILTFNFVNDGYNIYTDRWEEDILLTVLLLPADISENILSIVIPEVCEIEEIDVCAQGREKYFILNNIAVLLSMNNAKYSNRDSEDCDDDEDGDDDGDFTCYIDTSQLVHTMALNYGCIGGKYLKNLGYIISVEPNNPTHTQLSNNDTIKNMIHASKMNKMDIVNVLMLATINKYSGVVKLSKYMISETIFNIIGIEKLIELYLSSGNTIFSTRTSTSKVARTNPMSQLFRKLIETVFLNQPGEILLPLYTSTSSKSLCRYMVKLMTIAESMDICLRIENCLDISEYEHLQKIAMIDDDKLIRLKLAKLYNKNID